MPEVNIAGGQSATQLLFHLTQALRSDSDVSAASEAKFRKAYPLELPHLEAARLASTGRLDTATRLVGELAENVVWSEDGAEVPLLDHLEAQGTEPLPLLSHSFKGGRGWKPTAVYQGDRWQGANIRSLADKLVERRVITRDAGESLKWIVDNALVEDTLDLSGRKIVVFGGGAEMAPTRLWLEAGADVLWLDVQPPPKSWLDLSNMAGRLYWSEAGADLLTQPAEVLATVLAFSDGDSLDLGLYAYAPGQARELRLTAVMNAIVESMPEALVRSVTILVSPTTPTELQETDLAAAQERLETMPGLERVAKKLGFFGARAGYESVNGSQTTRSVVSIQGTSYQAAQYVAKVLVAEVWASRGLRVSANTAAITKTRSLDHPIFAAAFGGAEALGVETFAPRLSRRINGLLAVADWLRPELPTPGRVRVHGGIHTLPYPLEAGLKIAAGIGFARSPRLIGGLFK